SGRTPARAPARPDGTTDTAAPRDLAAKGPAPADAGLGDAGKILATAREDGELMRQLMAMSALERIEAAIGDVRFHRPTLARMLALQAQSAPRGGTTPAPPAALV